MWNRKISGLTAQLGALLSLAGAAAILLFCCLSFGGNAVMTRYFEDSGFQEKMTQRRIQDLQNYVSTQEVSAKDAAKLARWAKKQPLILMEVYRSNILLYSSSAPDGLEENEEEAPSYEWISYYPIAFADGDAEVVIYANDTFRWFFYLTIGALILSFALFLFVFLRGCRGLVRYICRLSEEIQAMEGGDLNQPITLQGNHELTQLAKSLDAMRQAFKTQRERENAVFRANQTMITEMSHDLRTPLTTLQIYTDILRFQKYEPERLHEYLEKIDTKASQIRQLAENIFEYSLISCEQAVEMDPPVSAQEVFHDILSEMVAYLSQQGFQFSLELDWPPDLIRAYQPYVKRLIDNISSNIVKYADTGIPVQIKVAREIDGVSLSFRNAVRPDEFEQESTHIGLSNIKTMMAKMGGICQIAQVHGSFQIQVCLPFYRK